MVCMGISLISWVFLKLSKTYETREEIRLQYNLPAGRQFVDKPPAAISINLSGSGWKLLYHYLFHKKATISFDLSRALQQEVTREELIARIEYTIGLDVTNLSVNYLRFSLDAKSSRRVPVVLVEDIQYSNDYYLRDSILLIPDSVTIYGSMQSLKDVVSLNTEKLTLSNPKSDERLFLKILKPENSTFEIAPQKVEVLIPVEQFTEKSFMLPVQIVNARDSVRILPTTVKVTCLVGLSHYEELDETSFAVQADFSNIPDLTQQNYVALSLASKPDWVRSVDFSPKSVEFLIVE